MQNASMDGFEGDLTSQNQPIESCVGGKWMFKSRRRCRDPLGLSPSHLLHSVNMVVRASCLSTRESTRHAAGIS